MAAARNYALLRALGHTHNEHYAIPEDDIFELRRVCNYKSRGNQFLRTPEDDIFENVVFRSPLRRLLHRKNTVFFGKNMSCRRLGRLHVISVEYLVFQSRSLIVRADIHLVHRHISRQTSVASKQAVPFQERETESDSVSRSEPRLCKWQFLQDASMDGEAPASSTAATSHGPCHKNSFSFVMILGQRVAAMLRPAYLRDCVTA